MVAWQPQAGLDRIRGGFRPETAQNGRVSEMRQTRRVTSPRELHSWRDAATQAAFVFYRPSQPEPDILWAGGYGYCGRPEPATTSLGVHGRLAGSEVIVEASPNLHRVERRMRVMHELDLFLLDRSEPIELPWPAEVVAEPRTIEVDGVPFDFDGVRVVGGTRWSGAATVGEVHVAVTTEDPAVVSAIERCSDLELPEFEPRA